MEHLLCGLYAVGVEQSNVQGEPKKPDLFECW